MPHPCGEEIKRRNKKRASVVIITAVGSFFTLSVVFFPAFDPPRGRVELPAHARFVVELLFRLFAQLFASDEFFHSNASFRIKFMGIIPYAADNGK